jgi:hypothetical protein
VFTLGTHKTPRDEPGVATACLPRDRALTMRVSEPAPHRMGGPRARPATADKKAPSACTDVATRRSPMTWIAAARPNESNLMRNKHGLAARAHGRSDRRHLLSCATHGGDVSASCHPVRRAHGEPQQLLARARSPAITGDGSTARNCGPRAMSRRRAAAVPRQT